MFLLFDSFELLLPYYAIGFTYTYIFRKSSAFPDLLAWPLWHPRSWTNVWMLPVLMIWKHGGVTRGFENMPRSCCPMKIPWRSWSDIRKRHIYKALRHCKDFWYMSLLGWFSCLQIPACSQLPWPCWAICCSCVVEPSLVAGCMAPWNSWGAASPPVCEGSCQLRRRLIGNASRNICPRRLDFCQLLMMFEALCLSILWQLYIRNNLWVFCELFFLGGGRVVLKQIQEGLGKRSWWTGRAARWAEIGGGDAEGHCRVANGFGGEEEADLGDLACKVLWDPKFLQMDLMCRPYRSIVY